MDTFNDAFPPILDVEDGFRLLELQRELPTHSGDIHGRLKYVRLSENPDYVAMSYSWGEAPPTKSITLANSVHIHITETLFHALAAVSDHVTTKYLWVDQICINQQDGDEKAFQVRAMSKIYTQAREVIAWLGPAASDTDLAFRHLRLLSLDGDAESHIIRDLEDAIREYGLGDVFNPRAPRGVAVASLTRRPWFSRLWVVQEVALASKLRLQCGQHTITGDSFFRAIKSICAMITLPPQPRTLDPLRHAYRIGRLLSRIDEIGVPSYPYLVHSLVNWGCKDDRDRLNALFGMVFRGNEASGAWFSPSYEMTAEKLYEKFAQSFIQRHNDLTILHFSGIGIHMPGIAARQEDGTYTITADPPEYILPQWVPDWRIRPRPLPLSPESCRLRPATAFRASLAAPRYSLSPDLLLLQVRAIQVDKVVECGPSWKPENAFFLHDEYESTDLPVLEKWLALAKRHARSPNFEADFASTLVMGGEVATAEFETEGIPDTHSLSTFFQQWRGQQGFTSEAAMQAAAARPPSDLNAGMAQYAYHVREICRTRVFFVTQNGRMGLGSIFVEPGHDVYIIHGLRTPFVVDRAPQRFDILRGDCYVHGLMDCGMQESDKDEDLYLR